MTNKAFGVLIAIGVFGLFILIHYASVVKKLKVENAKAKELLSNSQEQNLRLGFEVQRLSRGG